MGWLTECEGDWALVTGASSGMGAEFCRQLAAAGMNLVMVARRREPMEALAADLKGEHGIQSVVLSADLSVAGAAAGLRAELDSLGIGVRLLCNNAGSGRWGAFDGVADSSVYERMIALNAGSLMALCSELLPQLTRFTSSAVINVSSPAALQPVPYMAAYAASKALVHSFSQSLYWEWREEGVRVQTLVPGPTATDFDLKAGAYESALGVKRDSPAVVVRASLEGLDKDRPLVLAAKGTYQQRFFAGLFPAKMVLKTVAKMFRPPPQHT